jgi:LuxR family maltose regulon positive regulatory protein
VSTAVATSATSVDSGDAGGRRRAIARPALFELLSGSARVTLVSAPAGSGKTMLVRTWIADDGLTQQAAWVAVGRGERDPQRFWLAVLGALRRTVAGSTLVGALTAAPELDAAGVVERLLEDLSGLEDPLWLVVDDLHELEADDALVQLRRLVDEAPEVMRFVFLTRRDVRLGPHRLRLDGELTELRGTDLRFTMAESHALFESAGVDLSETALAKLVDRTEGWAAGLRLAALSLAGNPDPERFAADFSGSERTVAEYLLEEVLHRQPPGVSRLLLRTSILERVSGPLADQLTGDTGGERILAELAETGSFVVPLDPQRSWYRYHHLFGDLLSLELRRTAANELPDIHRAAAEWLAEHGRPVEAIRHAQAAEEWRMAAELLSDQWFALALDGQAATARDLLAGFPAGAVATDAELAAVAGAAELTRGALVEAERYVALARDQAHAVPAARSGRLQVALAMLRLVVARQRNDLAGVVEQTQMLLEPADAPATVQREIGEDLRAVALSELGIAEIWTGNFDDAERHLQEALEVSRRAERPLLELGSLAHAALLGGFRSSPVAEERARQAIDLARGHGWTEHPFVAAAYVVLGANTLWRGQLLEAEGWLERAQNALRSDVEPAVGLVLHGSRGLLEFARGHHEEARSAFRAAERLDTLLVNPHWASSRAQALYLVVLAATGETRRVEETLAALEPGAQDAVEMRVVLAALRLAEGDPEGVTAALEPILDEQGANVADARFWIQGLLLEAMARDALGDPGGTSRALEHALDVAEPQGLVLPFLLFPTTQLLERHLRTGTAHASLVSEILDLRAGKPTAEPQRVFEPLQEQLSDSELRVLRYLPTNLQAPEIASELFVSVNTIRSHMRHMYAKLGVHRRADAVQRARELGLLSPGAGRR